MKLVIQIPCYNEEKTLPITLQELPQKIKGIDEIEILVVDDGSTDKTADIARKHGCTVLSLKHNSGLGVAFAEGLNKALERGADIIVNIDADNQYCAKDMGKLVEPVLLEEADIVIGARSLANIKQWSATKRFLQVFGTLIVRFLSSCDIQDATSGYRAFSKDAAGKLTLFEKFSHTQETIMQAKAKNLIIKSVPIRINPDLRKSRLMKNIFYFSYRQGIIIMKNFIKYRPFAFFISVGIIFFILSLISYISISKLSFILTLIFSISGLQAVLLAFFSLLISHNRKMLDNITNSRNKKD